MNKGMSLLEVTFAIAIFMVVMGTIMSFGIGFADTARIQELKASGNDEARRALQAIVPDLRQAVRSTINWDQLPGDSISYCVPADIDGNGWPVDIGASLETSAARVIGRDTEDVNADGLSISQLVGTNDANFRVLANGVSPESEQAGAEGVFGPGQDVNGNGQMDCGIWFEPWQQGIRITIQTQGMTRKGRAMRTTVQEIVFPRN